MERKILEATNEFLGMARRNPPDNLIMEFRNHLLGKGILEPSEDDLVNAAIKVGIPEDEIPDFVEVYASRL